MNIAKKRNVTEKLDVSVPSKQFSDLVIFIMCKTKNPARLPNQLEGGGRGQTRAENCGNS